MNIEATCRKSDATDLSLRAVILENDRISIVTLWVALRCSVALSVRRRSNLDLWAFQHML